MSFSKYFRRKAYKWHRISSLIVAIPVMLWTISGFLHPVMGSLKPQVRNQQLPAAVLDTARISLPLHKALQQNNITQIESFRIVKLYEVFYYQVAQPKVDTLTYINCTSGTVLLNGDRNYAAYLAQRFLSEKVEGNNTAQGHHHGAEAAVINAVLPEKVENQKSRITSVKLITRFDEEYKMSNKLLPVYRVAFDRSDSIRLYIETPADRLALAVDSRKAWFTKFFAFAHTWSFLNELGKGKTILLGSFSLLCFVSGLMGFYVHRITSKKDKSKGAKSSPSKTAHRVLGNVFLTTTMLFAFSGAWHSFQKLAPKTEPAVYKERTVFTTGEASLQVPQIARTLGKGEKLNDVSIVHMNDASYWQATVSEGTKKEKRYLHTSSLAAMENGDTKYGCYLACKFSNRSHHTITHSRCLSSFNHNYSMMNKRLPVVEVGFDEDDSYFVETGTGTLAAVSTPTSRMERFSFSNLHMHHYWEMWLGKGMGTTLRNSVLILSTLGLMLAALTGMALYATKRWKK